MGTAARGVEIVNNDAARMITVRICIDDNGATVGSDGR